MSYLRRFFEPFTVALLLMVALAAVVPCRGQWAQGLEHVTHGAIALLFFLHGAKLSREAIVAGALHWRLHALVFAGTFILFPLLGWLMKPLGHWMLTPELYLGMLFLCTLPSTVQSSIAFTSMAGGNVPAAICSASASNLFGVFITPLLVSLLLARTGQGVPLSQAIGGIVIQILIPFILGQIARCWIGGWVQRHRVLVRFVDQGSILLVVYTAFSEAVIEGLWSRLPLPALGGLFILNAILLAVVLGVMWGLATWFRFSPADRITIVFCGSKKSLATGVPMAKVLFASSAVGVMVVPLMLFHQIQLMVCAFLAQRWKRSTERRLAEEGVPAESS